MELTEYEQEVFDKLDMIKDGELVIKFGVKYNILIDRPDREEFIAAVKKYIDCWNTFEFNKDYTKMKRCERINKLEDKLTNFKL